MILNGSIREKKFQFDFNLNCARKKISSGAK
jgi:hypothetical protein